MQCCPFQDELVSSSGQEKSDLQNQTEPLKKTEQFDKPADTDLTTENELESESLDESMIDNPKKELKREDTLDTERKLNHITLEEAKQYFATLPNKAVGITIHLITLKLDKRLRTS